MCFSVIKSEIMKSPGSLLNLIIINMSEPQSSEWKGQKQKQPKKQIQLQCDCGKKFQSTLALNAHKKTSHAGTGLNNGKASNRPSRGRPKQYQYKQLEKKANNDNDPLLELHEIQQQVGHSQLKGKQIYQNQPVYKLIQRFMEEDGEQLQFLEQDKIYDVTMGKGLSILLKEMKNEVQKEQFLNELILLITIYISYVIEETEDQSVLNNGSIGLLPEFANIFILYDLSKRCERLKITDSWIKNSRITISVLNIIFRWLIYKKFTHTMALVNEEFKTALAEEVLKENDKNDA